MASSIQGNSAGLPQVLSVVEAEQVNAYRNDVATTIFERYVAYQGAAPNPVPSSVQVHFITGNTTVSNKEAEQCSTYFSGVLAAVKSNKKGVFQPPRPTMSVNEEMAVMQGHPEPGFASAESAIPNISQFLGVSKESASNLLQWEQSAAQFAKPPKKV
jgi:hypothetical protein